MRATTILPAALAVGALAVGAGCSGQLPTDPAGADPSSNGSVLETVRRLGPDTSPNSSQPPLVLGAPRLGADTSPNRNQP